MTFSHNMDATHKKVKRNTNFTFKSTVKLFQYLASYIGMIDIDYCFLLAYPISYHTLQESLNSINHITCQRDKHLFGFIGKIILKY